MCRATRCSKSSTWRAIGCGAWWRLRCRRDRHRWSGTDAMRRGTQWHQVCTTCISLRVVAASRESLWFCARLRMRLRLRALLVTVVFALLPSQAHATVRDSAYATTVATATGWDYESRAIGSPTDKDCSGGQSGGSSQQLASYSPSNTYWLQGSDFTGLASFTNMHIKTVEVDANGANGNTPSGTINLDLGVTGPNVTSFFVSRTWSGATISCNWFSNKSGNPLWDVTSLISTLNLSTVQNMNVRARRHSPAGTSGSTTYYDVLVRSFKVRVTWEWDAPATPSGLSASACDVASVKLAWTSNTGEPGRICSYEITRSVDGAAFQMLVPASCVSPILGANANSYADYAVAQGHTYVYRLRALGEGGYSGYAIAGATTPGVSISWINPSGGDWGNASNWNLGRVPGYCDLVSITLPGTYTVTMTTGASVESITLGAASGTQTLAVVGDTLQLAGWSINPNGIVSLTNALLGAACPCSCTPCDDPAGTTVRGNTVMEGTSFTGSLFNEGSLRVRGSCSVGGKLVNKAGATITLDGNSCCGDATCSVADTVKNDGAIILGGASGAYGSLLTAKTVINNTSGNVVFTPGASGSREVRANPYAPSAAYGITNAGIITVNTPGTLSRFVSSTGSIACNAPLTIANAGAGIPAVTNTAGITLTGGTTLSLTGAFWMNSGTVTGAGSIAFVSPPSGTGLANSGVVAPGSSSNITGILANQGMLAQGSAGTVRVKIGGATPGTSFDQFTASGSAALSGQLDIALINGYQPPPGSSFHILRSNSRTGTFTTINGPRLAQGGSFSTEYSDPGLVLRTPGGPVAAPDRPVEARFYLDRPFPSPGRGAVRMSFGLDAPSDALLEVIDVAGHRVRTLTQGSMPAGPASVVWDGHDGSGHTVAPGIYYARRSAGGHRVTREFVILH